MGEFHVDELLLGQVKKEKEYVCSLESLVSRLNNEVQLLKVRLEPLFYSTYASVRVKRPPTARIFFDANDQMELCKLAFKALCDHIKPGTFFKYRHLISDSVVKYVLFVYLYPASVHRSPYEPVARKNGNEDNEQELDNLKTYETFEHEFISQDVRILTIKEPASELNIPFNSDDGSMQLCTEDYLLALVELSHVLAYSHYHTITNGQERFDDNYDIIRQIYISLETFITHNDKLKFDLDSVRLDTEKCEDIRFRFIFK